MEQNREPRNKPMYLWSIHNKEVKNITAWSSCYGSVVMNPTSIHEDAGSIPGLVQWVKDRHCYELWCRLQTQLRSGVAVAVV